MLPNTATRVYDILEFHARRTPDAEAAVDEDLRLSYSELRDGVDAIARGLLAAGVGRGDHVAILTPPSMEFWLTYLATTSIGAVWQGVNPRHQKPEFAYQLGDSKPKTVFVRSPYDRRDYCTEVQEAAGHVETFVAVGEATGRAVELGAFIAAGDAVDDRALAAARGAVDPEDIGVVVYTSGTTGRPKGAMLSHRAIVQMALDNVRWGREGFERALMPAPIDHVGGLNNLSMCVFTYGGTLVFFHRVDLAEIIELSAEEKPTLMVANPTTFVMLMAVNPSLESPLNQSLRLTIVGGAVTPLSMLELWEKQCPNTVCVYGQTETTGMITVTDPGAPMEIVADTFGKPLPQATLRIAREDGSECDIEEAGEIQVKGAYVMSGYLNRPEATAEAFTSDGFLRTGDLGKKRPDGNFSFVGRLKEMYKSGGYNIYPQEIEQALCSHPAVSAAAVVPVPHEMYQEVGHAFVMPIPGETVTGQALDAYLRERLANYKIPKAFTVEAELPLLPNTKIDKKALKRRPDGPPES
jgi:acyl-CoA synthetase (AMP-forming)/AMP-acid ligase II